VHVHVHLHVHDRHFLSSQRFDQRVRRDAEQSSTCRCSIGTSARNDSINEGVVGTL